MSRDTHPPAPVPSTATVFRLSLWRDGAHVGWLGESASEWAMLVPDIRRALLLQTCPYNGAVYYLATSWCGAPQPASDFPRFMAVSADACIGFYSWANASGFTREGRHLVADDTGQKLALQSARSGDLCAWNGCSVLEVGFEPVATVVSARFRR
ncbi:MULTISPECIES: hypothetical protein [unclassified Rhizobacter]|uniref:hypothetical protein n=1 Tax=unclassified Rhizobacter TaxID=2640088 RepID=UPI0006F2A5E4|nr:MULTISPECIES: hypothetical protein [unclassified Rhizobacter]KRB14453.1 hypothetical protein ASE08_08340 [Rhizobacter sp. Root16D2]